MAECVYADDAYLIARWPQVVVSTPGIWLVVVASVAVGDYTVTVAGIPYTYAADGTETVTVIRDELLALISMGLFVAVSPPGAAGLTLAQVQPGTVTVTAAGPSGPAPSEVTITQTAGSDNSATRALWLESAKCGLPDCCFFQSPGGWCGPTPAPDCTTDFTIMHASLAAHMIIMATSMGPTGFSAGSFETMKLGPASLTRATNNYATGVENDLGRTEPGKLVLALQRRYLPPIWCV